MHMVGKAVARALLVDHQHTAVSASQGQCSTEAGGAASDDNGVPELQFRQRFFNDLCSGHEPMVG